MAKEMADHLLMDRGDTMHRSYLLTMFVLILCVSGMLRGSPQAKKTPSRLPARTDSLGVRDTKAFFATFIGKKKDMPVRSQFETEQEYRKRCDLARQYPPFDSSKIIYFRVDSGSRYSYDISTETLTVNAGVFYPGIPIRPESAQPPLGGRPRPGQHLPIKILADEQLLGRYVGSTALGETATVRQTCKVAYVLDLLRMDEAADQVMDFQGEEFEFSIRRPAKEAERLSKQLEIIVGVRLLGYEHCDLQCVGGESPTIYFPTESSTYAAWIEGYLAKVILRNKVTLDVIAQYDVEHPKKPIELPGGKLTSKPTAERDAPVVSGVVTLKADASKATGTYFVFVYVDDALVGITDDDPFEFQWNTANYPNGLHRVTLEAKNQNGGIVDSKSRWLTVANTEAIMDPVPPIEIEVKDSNGKPVGP